MAVVFLLCRLISTSWLRAVTFWPKWRRWVGSLKRMRTRKEEEEEQG